MQCDSMPTSYHPAKTLIGTVVLSTDYVLFITLAYTIVRRLLCEYKLNEIRAYAIDSRMRCVLAPSLCSLQLA